VPNCLTPFSLKGPMVGPVTVHPVGEFRQIVERERARVERNAHGFLVASFDLGSAGGVRSGHAKCLSAAISRRLRVTDEVGWIDERHLGVLLFNTPEQGAWRFVDHVSRDSVSVRPGSVCSVSVRLPGRYGATVPCGTHVRERAKAGRSPVEEEISAFRRVLERERARADRNGHGFSLVSFEIGKRSGTDLVRRLQQVISTRARASDEIGWLDRKHLCVLLYNTPTEGAWDYVKCVRGALSVGRTAPECNVYTYPMAWEGCPGAGNGCGRCGPGVARRDGGRGLAVSLRRLPGAEAGRSLWGAREPEVIGTNVLALSPPRLRPERRTKPVRDLLPFLIDPMPLYKRAVDILGATAALVLFLPVMIGVAIAIKLTSRGPVLFKQERAGYRGKPFTCYKFRSMVVDAERQKQQLLPHNERLGVAFKMRNDPRVTPVGKFLRETSLDELPQLFNVLRGEMSLVGPRPLPVEEALQQDAWHNMRLEIVPGITCLWQIYARHSRCFDRWARLDIEYARKRSFLFDVKLLFLTIPAVLSRRGAH